MQSSHLSYLVRITLLVVDFSIVNLTFGIVALSTGPIDKIMDSHYLNYWLVFNLTWLFAANFFRMYTKENCKKSEQIFRTTWRSFLGQAILFLLYVHVANQVVLPVKFQTSLYSILFLGFLLTRFIGTIIEIKWKHQLVAKRQVAVLANNANGNQLANYFHYHQKEYQFQGFLCEGIDFFGTNFSNSKISKVIEEAVNKGIREVYVPLAAEQVMGALNLLKEAESQCVRFKFIPFLGLNAAHPYMKLDYLGDFPVVSLRKEPLENVSNRFRKRMFDVVFSAFVILFILSWLYPLLGLIIKIESNGPVLFKQKRSGRDNETFICYKFRTMVLNKESDKVQASENDQRITSIGRFLRKTSLDELPQFINVFKGEMSVVGPRPHMLKHTKEYSKIIEGFMTRHFLKPGITGWAQVNGYRGNTSNLNQMQKRVEHDIWYLENWSSMLDVKIIFITIISVFKGDPNAY